MAFYVNIGEHRVDLDHVTAIGSNVYLDDRDSPEFAIYTDRQCLKIDASKSLNADEIKILEAHGFLKVCGDTYVNPAHVVMVQSNEHRNTPNLITLKTIGRTFPNHPPRIYTALSSKVLARKIGGLLDITPNNNGQAYVRPECVDYMDFASNYFRVNVNGHVTGHDVVAIQIKQDDKRKIIEKMQATLPLIEVHTNGAHYLVNAANVVRAVESYRKDPNDTAIFYASSPDECPTYASDSPANINTALYRATKEFATHRHKSHAAAVT